MLAERLRSNFVLEIIHGIWAFVWLCRDMSFTEIQEDSHARVTKQITSPHVLETVFWDAPEDFGDAGKHPSVILMSL